MINHDIHSMKFVVVDGYLVNAETGERIVFYECDPNKNTVCDKSICRNTHNGEDHDFGFLSFQQNRYATAISVLGLDNYGDSFSFSSVGIDQISYVVKQSK